MYGLLQLINFPPLVCSRCPLRRLWALLHSILLSNCPNVMRPLKRFHPHCFSRNYSTSRSGTSLPVVVFDILDSGVIAPYHVFAQLEFRQSINNPLMPCGRLDNPRNNQSQDSMAFKTNYLTAYKRVLTTFLFYQLIHFLSCTTLLLHAP